MGGKHQKIDLLYWLDHRIAQEIRLAEKSGCYLVQSFLNAHLNSKSEQVP